MDGILVDFMSGAHKYFGLPYSYEEYPYELGDWDCIPPTGMKITPEEFWESLDEDHWANLPWMPDGKEILAVIESYFPKEHICLLTSPTLSPSCASGKVRWIQKEMPDYARRFLIGPPKYFCAHREALLIDDSDKNVNLFKLHGGRAICIPRKWNSKYIEAEADIPGSLREGFRIGFSYA